MSDDRFAPTYGEPETFEAVLEMDRVAGGKRYQGTVLLRSDGDDYVLSYRPDPSLYQYVGKRVRVAGTPYRNSPLVQSINATHFRLDSIELAPGEVAHEPVPTELPPPPAVRRGADLDAMRGRWIEAEGVLGDWRDDDGGGSWGSATVTFDDGIRVGVMVAKSRWEGGWKDLVGARVVVTAQVHHADGGSRLVGPSAVRSA